MWVGGGWGWERQRNGQTCRQTECLDRLRVMSSVIAFAMQDGHTTGQLNTDQYLLCYSYGSKSE